jgi:putative ABC transport system permease protein
VNLKNLIRLSLLELFRFRKITLFLIFNFSLGLIGFFLLQIFQQSLSAQTAAKAQVILGGDISINARRAFTEAERQEWEASIPFEKKSQYYGLFSMLRTKTDARLTSVGAFDSNFPLYGQFKLSEGGFSEDKPRVWVDPEVQEMLELKLHDQVEIGEASFEYSGNIVEDPSRVFS